MPNDVTLNAMSGGVKAASEDDGTRHHQLVKVEWGAAGTQTMASATNPLPVSSYGVLLTSASQAIAAAGTGTCGPVTLTQGNNVTVIVKNTVAASAWAGAPVLVFEQGDDGVQWSPLVMQRNDTGQALSTWTLGAGAANSELMFDAAVERASQVRVRCTTGPTTNGLTIVIQPGGAPFSPVVTTIPNGCSAATGSGPASITSAVTDTLILAANGARQGASIYNDSTATLYLSYGTNAASTTAFSVKMTSAGYAEVPFGYKGQIRGIWSAANGAARVTEFI